MSEILKKTGKRNPFNSKKFSLFFAKIKNFFEIIDDLTNAKLIKTHNGTFTQSTIELDNILRGIKNKNETTLMSSIDILDEIINSIDLSDEKYSKNLSEYSKFKDLLLMLISKWKSVNK